MFPIAQRHLKRAGLHLKRSELLPQVDPARLFCTEHLEMGWVSPLSKLSGLRFSSLETKSDA
jgi:hypothetical protein